MKTYHELLFEKLNTNRKIREEKRRLHKQFISANKTIFFYLDLMVLLMLLFNFGATTITNALVVKEKPDVEFYELNPVVAENAGYVAHEESGSFVRQLVMFSFAWLILLSTYIYYRRTVFTEEGLTILIIMLALFFIVLGADFFNDFGYWIGGLIK